MLQPLLHGLKVVIRWKAEPFIANVAEEALRVELPDIRIF